MMQKAFFYVVSFSVLLIVLGAQENSCTPQGGTYSIKTKTHAAQFPVDCTLIIGNVDIVCTPDASAVDGGLQSLSFLSKVHTIQGYLRIQDCDVLPSLNELSQLRTIEGTPDKGFVLWNNDMLTHLKGLENLKSIANGGVSIFHNEKLCYVDLMRWERIVEGATSADSPLIQFAQKSASCVALTCSACSCNFCGGPGTCQADCSSDSKAWIAAPVILGLLLFVLLLLCCVYLKKNDLIECQCFVTTKKSLKRAAVHPRKTKSVLPTTMQSSEKPPLFMSENDFAPLLQNQSHQQFQQQQQPMPMFHQNQTSPLFNQTHSPQDTRNASPVPSVRSQKSEPPKVFCICGKPGEFDCSRCGSQTYCSSECQRSHWKEHREACKASARRSTQLQNKGDEGQTDDGFGQCVMCQKPAEFECSRCRGPAYCSATCQRGHWREHGPECKKAVRASRAAVQPQPQPQPQPPQQAPLPGVPEPTSTTQPALETVVEVETNSSQPEAQEVVQHKSQTDPPQESLPESTL